VRNAHACASSTAKTVRIAGLVIAALTACACQYDPYTSSYATSKPSRQDIFGHWTATDATLAELSRGAYRKARPTIDVSEDGSIHMSDVPDTWRADFGEGAGKLETFVGTWQLRKHQDRWWGVWSCAAAIGAA